MGPPYKDVAEKYAGQKNAAATLASRIVNGTGPNGVGWMAEGKATLSTMPPNGNVSPGNALKLANWILGVKGEIAETARFVTEHVETIGLVQNRLRLTAGDLSQFHPKSLGELAPACRSGADVGKLGNLKGVLLKDVLDKAGVVSKSHNDVKKMAIVATASDDYAVVFSWSEIFNSLTGECTLVFFERDGKPLGDDEGRIALISPSDTRTGPRHVKWLKSIEVRKIVN